MTTEHSASTSSKGPAGALFGARERSWFYVVTDLRLADGRRVRNQPISESTDTKEKAQRRLAELRRTYPHAYISRWTGENPGDEEGPLALEAYGPLPDPATTISKEVS